MPPSTELWWSSSSLMGVKHSTRKMSNDPPASGTHYYLDQTSKFSLFLNYLATNRHFSKCPLSSVHAVVDSSLVPLASSLLRLAHDVEDGPVPYQTNLTITRPPCWSGLARWGVKGGRAN